MRAKRPYDKSELRERQGFSADGGAQDAHDVLMRRVFGVEPASLGSVSHWWAIARFDPGGHCVASVEVRQLSLLLDGQSTAITGLRRVAVDPVWRGAGLFRDLMEAAVRWCAEQTSGPTLLFTEHPSLYARFGFATVAQHAVIGTSPAPTSQAPARRLDVRETADLELLRRILKARSPVSAQCALIGEDHLVMSNILAQTEITASYADSLEAIILHEAEGDDLTLVDIVAAKIPTMSEIIGALGIRPASITVLFPPDRLDWAGRPHLDDAGLMCRGPLPAAMRRPFRLPPTAEF